MKFKPLIAALLINSCATTHAQSNFDYAITVVLKHEGVLENNKNDSGSITNYGVSLRFLKHEKIDINHDGMIDDKDIIHLTKDEASKIYLDDWWYRYHIDSINDKVIAAKLFDMSINMGHAEASKIMHRAMIAAPHPKCKEIQARDYLTHSDNLCINTLNPQRFHTEINKQCADYYRLIVKQHPSYKVFLNGWLKRADW